MFKISAFVGNTGHVDNEIDLAGSEGLEGMKIDDFSLRRVFLRWPRCDRAASGRLVDLCCATLLLCSFESQVLVLLYLFRYWKENKACKTDVYLFPRQQVVNIKPLKIVSSYPFLTMMVPASGLQERIYLLPKDLGEKVARLHLLALGADLTVFAQEHAVYTGANVEGPFKGGHYRYRFVH